MSSYNDFHESSLEEICLDLVLAVNILFRRLKAPDRAAELLKVKSDLAQKLQPIIVEIVSELKKDF